MSFPFVQPYFGLGNSLQTAQGAAGGGAVGGWVELGRTTAGSASTSLTVSSIPDKRYYMVLRSRLGGTLTSLDERLGNSTIDTGSNYAYRRSANGGADGTTASTTSLNQWRQNNAPHFGVRYISNLSGKEKLCVDHTVSQDAAGAGNAPERTEVVSKWDNTSNPIDIMDIIAASNQLDTGSECVVLGWDPADTHTTNFWEELASVNATGSSLNLSSGTFTAKKYLWVQVYNGGTPSPDVLNLTFNNDTGANYARRFSINGGADETHGSENNIGNITSGGNTNDTSLTNMFIINNSANEKLIIAHDTSNKAAGAANAPDRAEWACKWANTSSQITEIDIDASATAGNHPATSMIKVWGSD